MCRKSAMCNPRSSSWTENTVDRVQQAAIINPLKEWLPDTGGLPTIAATGDFHHTLADQMQEFGC